MGPGARAADTRTRLPAGQREGRGAHSSAPQFLVAGDGEVEVNGLFGLPRSLVSAGHVHVNQGWRNRPRFGFQLLIFGDRFVVLSYSFVTFGKGHTRLGANV